VVGDLVVLVYSKAHQCDDRGSAGSEEATIRPHWDEKRPRILRGDRQDECGIFVSKGENPNEQQRPRVDRKKVSVIVKDRIN